jgi:hypothetical protein
MGEKTIGSGRQGSVLSTYWVNKDECERRSTGQVGRETSSEEVTTSLSSEPLKVTRRASSNTPTCRWSPRISSGTPRVASLTRNSRCR